jgi:hypothetical protein
MTAAVAAIEISRNVLLAPLAAANIDSSGAGCARAVQYRAGSVSAGADASRTGSKNIKGIYARAWSSDHFER